jgi:hypothetical protein
LQQHSQLRAEQFRPQELPSRNAQASL